jgi:type II secretory ATPase GspE/PulE/Tfp pilus assembly ATPase PilB-like protein
LKKKKLGEVLQERGHISATDLSQIIAEQHGKVIRLGELMLDRGLVTKDALSSALEEVTHVPYLDCTTAKPSREVLALIPRQLAVRCCVFPIAKEAGKLIVVMAEPQNFSLSDELKFSVGSNISPRLGFRNEIIAAIEKHYGGEVAREASAASPPLAGSQSEDVHEMEFVSTSSRQANRDAIEEAQAELTRRHTPAVRLVSEVIMAAKVKGASDIHVEPQAGDVIVRIRVDGVLRDLQRVPSALQHSFVSRIKILADMDIAERRAPQDGRFLVRMGGKEIDLRVSTLPTQYGEKVVMRLLDSSDAVRGFPQLGLPEDVERILTEVLSLPQGMLLVTGPTGSGKSTTLYAALHFLRKPSVNIVTVEDPVEYVLPGINQVHVNSKAGLTFSSCLRSILRQDPNVIMVGEIRDKETAEISMKAAQTGHFVLSTLHTNDSVAAITRLVDLGIPPFMISSSVTAVLAQRLVRRLCECHSTAAPTREALARLSGLGMVEEVETVGTPVGCDLCDNVGYKGRVGIYEILVFDEAVRVAVRDGHRNDEIRNHMRDVGMRLMQQDALEKVINGVTSVEEVSRVVPVHSDGFGVCVKCTRKITPTFQFCPHCGAEQRKAESRSTEHQSRMSLEGSLR